MELIQKIMAEQHLPGLAIGIQRDGEWLYEGYHGLANVEHDVKVNENMVFEIASVTKLFTTQAVLRLAQDGKLKIDDKLVDTLPSLPAAWQPVTIRHVLAHQSGLPSYTSEKRYWEITQHSKTHEEVIDLVRDKPLSFEPGARNAYDNTGFYLLGMVIEAVTGKRFGETLREIIFEPLGLARIQANDYNRIVPHRAQGYIYHEGAFQNKPYYDLSNTFSAGVLISNVRDLIKWSASLYNDSVLNDEMRGLWWTPHPSQAKNEREFDFTVGLGWFMVDSPLGLIYAHNGGVAGFASTFIHFPDTRTTAVALLNAANDEPYKIVYEVLQPVR